MASSARSTQPIRKGMVLAQLSRGETTLYHPPGEDHTHAIAYLSAPQSRVQTFRSTQPLPSQNRSVLPNHRRCGCKRGSSIVSSQSSLGSSAHKYSSKPKESLQTCFEHTFQIASRSENDGKVYASSNLRRHSILALHLQVIESSLDAGPDGLPILISNRHTA